MQISYVARKYVALEGGAKHYYEEAIFSSYELAYNFIQNISEEDDDFYLSEIVGYTLDSQSRDDESDIYVFNRKGELLIKDETIKRCRDCIIVEKNENDLIETRHDPESFSGKINIGDIVLLRAYPWNPFSPVNKDTIGVVSVIPYFFDIWIANGNEKYTWDNTYVVDCIRNGYLGHWHIEEKGITPFKDELPDNLRILQILSEHYRTGEIIPADIMDKINSGKLFVEKVSHFNFDDFKKVQEPGTPTF